MSNSEEEITFKIITVGESGVGKTAIIKRFVYGKFDENAISTIGLSFCFKDIKLNNNKQIKLKLIDTGGQERFRALSKSYFKNAEGVLFVFGLDNKKSFDEIQNWINTFNENCSINNIPKFLVGNKCDLIDKITVDKEGIDKIAKNNNIKYIETSAKENILIEDLFIQMVEILYEDYKKSGKEKTGQIKLESKKKKKRNNCCVKGDLIQNK